VRRVSTLLPFSVTYPADPEDHIFGTWKPNPNPSLAYADGYWVLVKPLTPGKYVLQTFGDVPSVEFSLRIKYILTVVGPKDQ
jgi:hypothetical protein